MNSVSEKIKRIIASTANDGIWAMLFITRTSIEVSGKGLVAIKNSATAYAAKRHAFIDLNNNGCFFNIVFIMIYCSCRRRGTKR